MMKSSASHSLSGSGGESDLQVWERLAELERRSLLAEQARQLAHHMRTPLNVIELICETLQIELQHEQSKAERLDAVLDAVARLSTTLTDTVKSNRFASGPPRDLDAIAIAAQLVRLHEGDVEDRAEARPKVLLDPNAFEAAILHALRLIGVGGRRGPRPLLRCAVADGVLTLRLAALGAPVGILSNEALMVQAAARVAREGGGRLSVDDDAVTFQLPIAGP